MSNCPRCDLEPDFIPKRPKDLKTSKVGEIREVKSWEFQRCGAPTGHDIQSGPIYCGDRAAFMAEDLANPGCIFAVCGRHAKGLRNKKARQEESPAVT